MFNYIKRSIAKFKEDALSKLTYDLSKWLLLGFILWASTKFIPDGTVFENVISRKIDFTVYQMVLLILVITALTIFGVYVAFNVKYKKLQTDYFKDELTGLKNHKALQNYLEQKLSELKTNSNTLSLILIDIDNFGKINAALGYNTADEILKKVGELLGSDKRVTDETYRYHAKGDEFLIVTNDTSLVGAFRAAERKRELIANTGFDIDGNTHRITVSCGVVEYKRNVDDKKSITDRVSAALQLAKNEEDKNCSKSIV